MLNIKLLATAVQAATLTYRLTTVSLLLAHVAYVVYKHAKNRRDNKKIGD